MEGQTVMTWASADSDGTTPAMACFMACQPVLRTETKKPETDELLLRFISLMLSCHGAVIGEMRVILRPALCLPPPNKISRAIRRSPDPTAQTIGNAVFGLFCRTLQVSTVAQGSANSVARGMGPLQSPAWFSKVESEESRKLLEQFSPKKILSDP